MDGRLIALDAWAPGVQLMTSLLGLPVILIWKECFSSQNKKLEIEWKLGLGPKTRGHLFARTLCLFPCNWWLIKWKVLTTSANIFYPGIQVCDSHSFSKNYSMLLRWSGGVLTSGCVWPNISLPGPPIWCLDTGNHCIAEMDNIRFPSRDSYSRCNIEYMAVKILYSWFGGIVQNILSLLKAGDLICFIRNCQIWNFRNMPKVEMNYGKKILLGSIISSCFWQTKIPFQFESGPAGKTGREFRLFFSLLIFPVQNHHWQFLPAIKWDFNCRSFLPASDHMHWRSSRTHELGKFMKDESWNPTFFVSIELMK